MSSPYNQQPPSYYEAPPPYSPDHSPASSSQSHLQQLRAFCQRHEISDFFANKLRQLEGYDIVVICDDSGSMSTPCLPGGAVSLRHADPYAPRPTRWSELVNTLNVVTEIACLLDSDGIDVYFLNRPPLRNVKNREALQREFAKPPAGWTPLARTLRQVLREKQQVIAEKKLLIIIATDGEPTNEHTNQVDIATFKHVLVHERNAERIHVSFLACTDDSSTMSYLQRWDEEIKHLDVVDDFQSEREEIIKAQGKHFHFGFNDYICKLLLGSIDPEIDALDEQKGMCTIL